jgi:hypothetical protein
MMICPICKDMGLMICPVRIFASREFETYFEFDVICDGMHESTIQVDRATEGDYG